MSRKPKYHTSAQYLNLTGINSKKLCYGDLHGSDTAITRPAAVPRYSSGNISCSLFKLDAQAQPGPALPIAAVLWISAFAGQEKILLGHVERGETGPAQEPIATLGPPAALHFRAPAQLRSICCIAKLSIKSMQPGRHAIARAIRS